MNAKEYLSQVLIRNRQIERMTRQADYFRNLAEKCTSTLRAEPPGTHSTSSRVEYALTELVDLERAIDREIDAMVEVKEELRRWIMQLKDPLHANILEMRYIGCYEWNDVAAALGYHVRWVHRLHQNALQNMETILKQGTVLKEPQIGHPRTLESTRKK